VLSVVVVLDVVELGEVVALIVVVVLSVVVVFSVVVVLNAGVDAVVRFVFVEFVKLVGTNRGRSSGSRISNGHKASRYLLFN
jgi:hypothetical protein